MPEFNLDLLKKNLERFSNKFGVEFVRRIGEKVEASSDFESLRKEVLAIFTEKGTTFFQEIDSQLRVSSFEPEDDLPMKPDEKLFLNEIQSKIEVKQSEFEAKKKPGSIIERLSKWLGLNWKR